VRAVDILKQMGDFVWAVITNWAGYATGGVIVALVSLWSLLRKIPPSKKFGVVLALVFLFVALFNAWRDQYVRSHPALVLKIDQNGVGVNPDGEVVIFIQASIFNRGAPTILRDWSLFVTPPGKAEIRAENHLITKESPIVFHEASGTVTFDPEDTLYYKTTSPVVSGGQTSGVLVFGIKGETKEAIAQSGTKLKLTCTDVFDNLISVEVPRKGLSEGIKFVPGINVPKRQSP
jgi:hypothetical protein